MFLLLCGVAMPATAQDNLYLRGKITGRVYQDDWISVRAPEGWSLDLDVIESGDLRFTRGALLRKGNYILRLCTGCEQVSGVVGGRFSEIAFLVQPWYRSDPGAKPGPCGVQHVNKASKMLDRVDFWYRRDVAHPYNEDTDDCREPKTTATIWYGSYFAEHCSFVKTGRECGGYFLHDFVKGRSTDTPDVTNREMAFGMTYETTDLDHLPHKGDPELSQVLREATVIVTSIRYRRH